MSSAQKPASYIVYIFLILVLGALSIALYYTFEAFLSFGTGLNQEGFYQLTIGLLGVIMSMYMFMQFRKRLTLVRAPPPRSMITIIECKKCGLKRLRKFAKGDFVLKNVENCEKCNIPMVITGIYAEEAKKTSL